jgi:DNA-binding CsgD family transcriptional regulator
MALPRDGRSPLVVTAAPLPERVGERGKPTVLVLLRDPETTRPRAAFLRDAFGLTPAEAAVAAALCCGAPVSKIAAELGVGLSTVRTHLKSALLKTGTRRQAELVALLFGAAITLQA